MMLSQSLKLTSRLSRDSTRLEPRGRTALVSSVPFKLGLVATMAVLIGLSGYLMVEGTAPRYQAQAKVLLLAPQERYFPTDAPMSANAHTYNHQALEDEAKRLLLKRSATRDLVQQLGIDQNPAMAQRTGWNWVADLTRFGLVERSALDKATDNILDQVRVSYLSDRRLLLLTVATFDPEQASNLANGLAKRYIDLLENQREVQFLRSVEKLKLDIDRLQTQYDQTKANLPVLPYPSDDVDVSPEEWQRLETERIKPLEKKAEAEARMLDHMLQRYQESSTRQALDLLPPQARILTRATAPETSMQIPYVPYHVLSCLIFVFFGCRVILKHRFSKHAPSLLVSQANYPAGADILVSDMPTAFQTQDVPREDLGHMVSKFTQRIAEGRHKRVVLMSETPDWGGLQSALAADLTKRGARVVCINLCHFNDYETGVGIADLIDERATCGDVLRSDGPNALHFIDPGTRALEPEDFFSHGLHALLLALETSFDVVMIDTGEFFDDEFALKSLGVSPDSLVCLYAQDLDADLTEEVRAVVKHFGYQDCLIFPNDIAKSGEREHIRSVAA